MTIHKNFTIRGYFPLAFKGGEIGGLCRYDFNGPGLHAGHALRKTVAEEAEEKAKKVTPPPDLK